MRSRLSIDKLLILVSKLTQGQMSYGTLEAIGQATGFSREYVRLRMKKLELIPQRVITENKYCIYCSKKYKQKNKKHKLCSPKCRKAYHLQKYWEIRVCDECGFGYIKVKTDKENKIHCSNTCKGKWLGKNYGRNKSKAKPLLKKI